ATTSRARRDLPIPASPTRTATDPRPLRASTSARRSAASSRARPTTTGQSRSATATSLLPRRPTSPPTRPPPPEDRRGGRPAIGFDEASGRLWPGSHASTTAGVIVQSGVHGRRERSPVPDGPSPSPDTRTARLLRLVG